MDSCPLHRFHISSTALVHTDPFFMGLKFSLAQNAIPTDTCLNHMSQMLHGRRWYSAGEQCKNTHVL